MDKNLLNWDSGELLISPLHFIFCFVTIIFWLGRDCFACLFPLLPPKYVLLEGKVYAILCPGTWHHTAAWYTSVYRWDTGLWAVRTETPLQARTALPSLSGGGAHPADTLPTRKANGSQALRHVSVPQRRRLEQHTLSLNTHTMH